ncbi:TraR/DksA C4-type zinc finger protein [Marinibactrum halimedae]|uniref:RNA polymerase-binding transcription factor DksA n=1 Tax=Marinibactrum halimedae TaxID=1444977 RepID=A0AA37TAH1_9GAMM|nr:TraR/DksA C4-type zinc finger protein [Marinibactrum halimedae]MCD9460637.1 TraR/DksA C4-type zinc finger protein [Marinibactrum halimedae]GLS27853.1 RNA polymerase-binding transcription factor DksA [Marinibactrum halimedae]
MEQPNVDLVQLSTEQILEAPESDYMNSAQLEFFRGLLIELYNTTNERIQAAKELMASPPEVNDENDRASWEEQSNMSLRILEREQKLLPKIKESLSRIRSGSYGYCLESGEPIGIQRLLARPTAEYCAEVKAVKEIKENAYRA